MLKSIKKGLSELILLTLLGNPIFYAFAGQEAHNTQQVAATKQPINKRLAESKKKDLENILKTIDKYEVSIFSGAAIFNYNDGKFNLTLTPPYKNPNGQDKGVSFNYQFKNLYNSFHNLIADGKEVEKKFDKWFFSALHDYLKRETKRKIPNKLRYSNTCNKLDYEPSKTPEGIYFFKDKKTNESCGFAVFSEDITKYVGTHKKTFFSDYAKVLGDPYKGDRAFEAIFRPHSTITFNTLPLIELISRQKLEDVIKTYPVQPEAKEEVPKKVPPTQPKPSEGFIPVEQVPEEKQTSESIEQLQPTKPVEEQQPPQQAPTPTSVKEDIPPKITGIIPLQKCFKENAPIKVKVNAYDEERDALYTTLTVNVGKLNQFNKFIGTPTVYNFNQDYIIFPEGYKEHYVLLNSTDKFKGMSDLESDVIIEASVFENKNPENNDRKTIIFYNLFKECASATEAVPLPQKESPVSEEPKPKEQTEEKSPQKKPQPNYIAVELPAGQTIPAREEPQPKEQYEPLTPVTEQAKKPTPEQAKEPKPSKEIPVTQPSKEKIKEKQAKNGKIPARGYKGTHKPYFSNLEVSGVLKNIYERYTQPIGLNANSTINLNLSGAEISESARLGRFYESLEFKYLDGNQAKLHGRTQNPESNINGAFNAIEKDFNAVARLLAYNSNNIVVSPGLSYKSTESKINGNAALDLGGETSLNNKTIDTIYSAGIDAQFKGKIGYGIGLDASYRKQNNRVGLDLEGPAYNIKLNSNIDLGKFYIDLDGSYNRANMKFTDFKRADNTFDINSSASYNLGNHFAIGIKYNYTDENSNQKYNGATQFRTRTKENTGGIFFRIE